MAPNCKVVVVILNYMTYELTQKCVDDLLSHSRDMLDVIIVDNNSSNDSFYQLQSYFAECEKCTVIKAPKNGGYAYGNNIGLRYAYERGYRYAMMMNNDVFLDQLCITQALKYLQTNNNCLCAGPMIITNGRPESVLREKRPSAYREIGKNFLLLPLFLLNRLHSMHRKKTGVTLASDNQNKEAFKVYAISGCCIFADLQKMQKIDYLDEGTFLYCEEFIIGERALAAGYDIVFLPMVSVNHLHGSTTMSIYSEHQRDLIVEKSMEYYIQNYRNDNSKLKNGIWILSERFKNNVCCPIIYRVLHREMRKNGSSTN